MESKIHIVSSKSDPKTWFIFREDNVEVKVVIENNLILPNRELTPDEVSYIKKNILEVGDKRIK